MTALLLFGLYLLVSCVLVIVHLSVQLDEDVPIAPVVVATFLWPALLAGVVCLAVMAALARSVS
jgi:hypothetical protein